MKVLSISFLLLGFCCFENGYAKLNTDCDANMTALPPEIGTGCCGSVLSGLNQTESRETALNQFPWTVVIEYISRTMPMRVDMCGGALISGRYVLTSAHCITGTVLFFGVPTTIRLGDYNKTYDSIISQDVEKCTEGETRIQIDKTIPHPQYNSKIISSANDVGLIRMKEKAPYTDFIRPICLPTEDVTLKAGQLYFIFAGWGTLRGSSPVKLQLDLPLVPKDQCQSALSAKISDLRLDESHFCAGGVKGKDAYRGDAGLPLIYETNGTYVVAGMVSFGAKADDIKIITFITTNVYPHNTWIRRNINL